MPEARRGVRAAALTAISIAIAGCANGVKVTSSGAGGASDAAAGTGSGATTGVTSTGASGSTTTSGATTSSGASSSSSSSGGGCASPSDCPPSGTACATATCVAGACGVVEAPAGTPCANGGGKVCDGAGTCAQCIADGDCNGYPDFVCSAPQCVAATCTDGKVDGNEHGVDCGGGTCPGCPNGTPCNQGNDCATGTCVAGTCVDCGGANQPCCPGGACDAMPDTCAENTSVMWGGGADECDCGVLRPGQELTTDQGRWSCDGRFYLVMQSDGNLVLYSGVAALWSSNTAGTGGDLAVMQSDGNFVVYANGTPLWASGTSGATDWYLAIQNDGNVVVYDGGGQPHWSTNTCCH